MGSLWFSPPSCSRRHYLTSLAGSGTWMSGDSRTRTRRRSGMASRCRRCWSAFGSGGRWSPVCRHSWSPPCCLWLQRDRCRRSCTASWCTGPETDTCCRRIQTGTWKRKNGNVFNLNLLKRFLRYVSRSWLVMTGQAVKKQLARNSLRFGLCSQFVSPEKGTLLFATFASSPFQRVCV